MKIYKIIIRTILIIFFSYLFVWLIGQNLVASGHFVAETNFCNKSNFISYLYPENRISPIIKEDKLCYQKIFVEPAYFKIKIPRTFYNANVEIEYKNEGQDIVNLGVMKKRLHPLDWRFKIKPLENKYLDNLNWHYIKEDGISLWQKNKKYSSVSDFVNNLPNNEEIIVFNYDFDNKILDDSKKIIKWHKNIDLSDKNYIIADYISPKKL